MVEEIKKRSDVDLINFEYSYTGIHEDTDLKYFDITRNQGSKERAKLPQLFQAQRYLWPFILTIIKNT